MERVDSTRSDLPDEIVEIKRSATELASRFEFLTGAAGTGKTFEILRRLKEDSQYAQLTATTGIAAVNLGTITLHSALGLHPDSVEDSFTSGRIRMRMHQLAMSYRNLVIDEISMLSATMLDMLARTVDEVNEYADMKEAFGLILVGDFCQLPPINEPWAFEAECWPSFESKTTRLTKNWRQGDGTFLDALNSLRSGNGARGATGLRASNVAFARALDPGFDGTVILGRNAEVDNYNLSRFWKLKGLKQSYASRRWGKESGGWKLIPERLELKEGAYVMVLANDTERDELTGAPMFRWVNGDCGKVVEMSKGTVDVELVRTKQVVTLGSIERRTQQKSAPDDFTDAEIEGAKQGGPYVKLSDGTFYDPKKGMWVRGAITYMPLRLAYATTVHKSQGLTLDRIQVDLRHSFLGAPGMTYVALSRCRTAEGLHLVGDAAMIERRCKTAPEVMRWL